VLMLTTLLLTFSRISRTTFSSNEDKFPPLKLVLTLTLISLNHNEISAHF